MILRHANGSTFCASSSREVKEKKQRCCKEQTDPQSAGRVQLIEQEGLGREHKRGG